MTCKRTYIRLAVVSLLLTSCILLEKKEVKEEVVTKKNINDYTDKYTIVPKNNLLKFKELVANFEKQEHRFEIEKCQFKYNGQSFFIGDNSDKIIQIFGEPDNKIKSLDAEAITFFYKKLKIDFRFSLKESKLIHFWVHMSDYQDYEQAPYKVIKFRQIPYQVDMTLNQFMELSDLTHDKLRRSRFYFFMLQKECPPSKTERIYTYLDSEPIYSVEGSGRLTWIGDFEASESSVLKGIEVSVQTLDSLEGLKKQ